MTTTAESQNTAEVPEGFEDFIPFLDWALPTHTERAEKKMVSTFEEAKALYDLGMTDQRLVDVLKYCDQFPLDDLPAPARNVFLITLSMAEVRPQIELYKQIGPPQQVHPSRLPMEPQWDGV